MPHADFPPEEAEEQAIGWAYGNAHMANAAITREMVQQASRELRKRGR